MCYIGDVMNDPKHIPTEEEIRETEAKLVAMKQAREEAKRSVIAALKSPDTLSSLTSDDALQLIRLLQLKLRGARRKVRGLKVPDAMKSQLEHALIEGGMTLSQMEKAFGLSVSYISRVKRALKDAGKINGDHVQEQHHQEVAA